MKPLQVVLHAPTPGALARARRNALNLMKSQPDSTVRIIANGTAVAAALAEPDTGSDKWLSLCRNSLTAQGLENTAGVHEVDAAVVTLVELQADGWAYVRT